MTLPTTISDTIAEFEALEEFGSSEAYVERMRLVRKLGEALEPMPEAFKTESTQVPGCASKVWVYPIPTSDSSSLRFYADSNTDLTKGIIALILMTVQGKSAREVLEVDVEKELEPLGLQTHFSSLRTSGLANMILKIRQTAERLAA
jgi:cysteine desulfuration protein SufE